MAKLTMTGLSIAVITSPSAEDDTDQLTKRLEIWTTNHPERTLGRAVHREGLGGVRSRGIAKVPLLLESIDVRIELC